MALLKQSTTRNLVFLMIDSTDHITGKTALTVTVTLSKDGGAFAAAGGTVTEISSGWYKIALTTTDTNTLGCLALHATATGADATDVLHEVVADLPGATVSSVTGAVGSVTAGVTVTTNNDKTGYSLSQTFPTNFSSLAVDASGRVDVGKWLGTAVTAATTAGKPDVVVVTNNDKTGYTASTVSDKTGYSVAVGGIGSGAIASAERNNVADAFLDRVMSAGTDSGADNTTSRTVRQALRPLRNKVSISGGTLTVTKEDDTTASHTSAVTTTAGNPISSVDPT